MENGCLCSTTCRFTILCVFMVAYLCFGAAIFRFLEGPKEDSIVLDLRLERSQFLHSHNCLTEDDLEKFVQLVIAAANRGVYATRNVTMTEPNWSFGQAMFFAGTVLTTIGYGRVTPLSDAGKAFCIVYAVFGIPLTLILFTAIVERLMVPTKKLLYLLYGQLGHMYKVFHIQLLHLFIVFTFLIVFFFLIPAGIYTVLEPKWNYLDAFYYCFISLTTIGLGDYIPGDNAEQHYRALYKVATTGYLMLGLVMMMLLLAVLYEIPELNLGFHFYMKSDEISEEEVSLRSSMKKEGLQYTKQVDDKSSNLSTQGLNQDIDE
ncbi:potassium channel subfamily K member 1-like [Gigantopelta aegis]|uniref:potassium channel subfamily K member 1-like n=1 Tax=Gigantopelta aegis TaxID=1735272 RepID=UPI001B88A703|nr:potassium channel subfamily K member 1-like [Gigantopelta aegis]